MILFVLALLLKKPTLHFVKEWEIEVPAKVNVGLGSVSGRLYVGDKLVDLKTGALLNKNLGDGDSRVMNGLPVNTRDGQMVQIAGNPYFIFWKGQKVWVALQENLHYMNFAMIKPHTREITKTFALYHSRLLKPGETELIYGDVGDAVQGVASWFYGNPDKGYLTILHFEVDLGQAGRNTWKSTLILLPQRRLAKPDLWRVTGGPDFCRELGNPSQMVPTPPEENRVGKSWRSEGDFHRYPTQLTCFNAFTGKIVWKNSDYESGVWVGKYVIATPYVNCYFKDGVPYHDIYDHGYSILNGSTGKKLAVTDLWTRCRLLSERDYIFRVSRPVDSHGEYLYPPARFPRKIDCFKLVGSP